MLSKVFIWSILLFQMLFKIISPSLLFLLQRFILKILRFHLVYYISGCLQITLRTFLVIKEIFLKGGSDIANTERKVQKLLEELVKSSENKSTNDQSRQNRMHAC